MSAGAAGFDLHSAEHLTLKPGEIALVPTGFAIALPPHHEGQVRARSGLATRHGVAPVNSPGTVDADYRGELKVPLINHGREAFVIRRGDRIAQLVVCPVPPIELQEVDQLPETDRGSAGFGSTGIASN